MSKFATFSVSVFNSPDIGRFCSFRGVLESKEESAETDLLCGTMPSEAGVASPPYLSM